jgi:hypothetical protein
MSFEGTDLDLDEIGPEHARLGFIGVKYLTLRREGVTTCDRMIGHRIRE